MTPEDIAGLPYRPCAGVVLMRPEGLVWAGKRIDSTYNAWQMPQGGIDPGETPVEAALRELTEETGVTPDLVTVVGETEEWIPYELPTDLIGRLWKGRYRGQTQKWVLMRFNGSDADVTIETEEPEFSDWAWMAPDALMEAIVPFKLDTYRAVFAAFRDEMTVA